MRRIPFVQITTEIKYSVATFKVVHKHVIHDRWPSLTEDMLTYRIYKERPQNAQKRHIANRQTHMSKRLKHYLGHARQLNWQYIECYYA